MDSRETGKELPADGTPQDVAALYSWANLHGAKYRDFSASRREYRAQVRYRAAQVLCERELQAQAAAEAAAVAAERAAEAAETSAGSLTSNDSETLRLHALRSAEAAARKAVAERVEARRHGELAAKAASVAEREEREIAEAHASSERQATNYAEAEARRLELAGPQPPTPAPEEIDPYTTLFTAPYTAPSAAEGEGGARQLLHAGGYTETPVYSGAMVSPGIGRDAAALRHEGVVATASWFDVEDPLDMEVPLDPELDAATMGWALERAATDADPDWATPDDQRAGPAWLYSPQAPRVPPRALASQAISQTYGGGTLQDSRERVAARWFALKGVFEHAGPEHRAIRPAVPQTEGSPLLLVFSLAGGVGKTSLVATLGRALAVAGERVVLTDTTSHGLLPFYFGARELPPGVMRAFSPPDGRPDEPIYLVSYDVDSRNSAQQQESLTEEILRNGEGNQRMLLDLGAGAGGLIRRMANLRPTVLVPVAPDMNSVISLQAVERFFQGIAGADGRLLLPFYVLNQFDATLPLHLDVREVLRRQLGDRLLNFAIRRSPAVSEALAEGMTVIDYAPEAAVTHDYLDIAAWLRRVSPADAMSPQAQRSEP